jgi:hypothetical protein
MSVDLFLAQLTMEERVKDALREAEQARLGRTVENPKGIRPFLFAAMQHLGGGWEGGNGRKQPTMDNTRPRTSQQNLTG